MPPLTFWQAISIRRYISGSMNRRFLAKLLGVILLILLISIEVGPLLGHSVYAEITPLNHTSPGVDEPCRQISFSPDNNPLGLCPGPYPQGGNCVWWGWEMWHLLGYDLPRNWGNAADWIADAERTGLPMGTTPRVGSIAVFPVGDGVWAFTSVGHVAFVTSVSGDGSTFNVTYQNYGDPTPMHVGTGYPVSVINQPRYQHNNLRFIYFPRPIDPRLFARLPGVDGNAVAGVANANNLLAHSFSSSSSSGGSSTNTSSTNTSSTSVQNQLTLGLFPSSTDQEFNADFAGNGLSDLLLYNRVKGTLSVLSFTNQLRRLEKEHLPTDAINDIAAENNALSPQLTSLSDATTPANGWGQSLDIHIGDFAGTGRSDILLYDRVAGTLQLISLTPQLAIQKHVILPGWGTGWELYVARLDGHRSTVFMYNRLVNSVPIMPTTPTPSATAVVANPQNPISGTTPVSTPPPASTSGPSPTSTPSPKPSATPSPTPKLTCATSVATVVSPGNSTTCSSPTPGQKPKAARTRVTKTALILLHGANQGLPIDNDLSSSVSSPTEQVVVSNVNVVNFDQNFKVLHFQQYTLLDNSWEVYTGSFVSRSQDALFLYDRMLGEARLLSFDAKLHISHYQAIHNLDANWEVHSGDFIGSGRSQVLLYDPSSGDAQIEILKSDLSLSSQKSFSGWGANQALYVGHFGTPTLNVMLYDPQTLQSTFIAFDASLIVKHQITMPAWDNRWQVLIGAFLDRSRSLAAHNCSTGDDILVLNRQTGQMQQFVFSFGTQYRVIDNRSQGYVRTGAASTPSITPLFSSTSVNNIFARVRAACSPRSLNLRGMPLLRLVGVSSRKRRIVRSFALVVFQSI